MTVTRGLSYNLFGTVMNMGLGVTGATVRLYDYWNRDSGLSKHFLVEQTTGPRGTFNFDVRKGIYCIEVIPSPQTRFARQSFETIKVTANTECPVVLKAGCMLEGKVRDAQGNLMNNCELQVFGIEPHVLRVSEPVREDGTYSISLPHGRYYASIHHRPVAAQVKKGKKGPVDQTFLYPVFEVVELAGDLKKDFEIPELLKFNGVVTNSQGHPVSQVKVSIHALDRPENVFVREIPLEISTSTGKDGKFETRLKPGNYSVRLEPPSDSSLAEKTIAQVMVDQDRNRTYALDDGRRLSGRVHFDDEPVTNAMITVFGANSRYVRMTDEEGRYYFSLPGGTYEMSVVLQPDSLGQIKEDMSPWTAPVKLGDDIELDVPLDEGIMVSGRVLDPDKQPREGVLLAVYQTREGKYDATGAAQHPLALSLTGADGVYEFRLREGQYWLVLNNQPSTGHIIEVAEKRKETDVTVQEVCVVTFEVVSEESEEPIPNCLISFEQYTTKSGAKDRDAFADLIEPSMTGADGRCTLTMPEGIYSFHFHPPEDSAHAQRLIRQLSVISDMTRRVKLAPADL